MTGVVVWAALQIAFAAWLVLDHLILLAEAEHIRVSRYYGIRFQ